MFYKKKLLTEQKLFYAQTDTEKPKDGTPPGKRHKNEKTIWNAHACRQNKNNLNLGKPKNQLEQIPRD